MARVTYGHESPYSRTPQTSWYLGHYQHRSIPASVDDRLMVLDARYHQRPDILSNDLYGTPAYWWVFMARNMNVIRDPIRDFKAGIQIYLPSADSLRKALG